MSRNSDLPRLSQEQEMFVNQFLTHVDAIMDGRLVHPRPFVVTGRPGSGKTVAAQTIEAECTEREMDVLIASPTGMLAAN